MSKTFNHYCELSAIIKDFVWECYGGEGTGLRRRATLEFAETTYHNFLSWADSLPIDLARGD
jgi:hypothetical protein